MNGVRIDLAPGASIAVDYWRRDSALSAGCFLTHMHADHTVGLGDSWTGPPLFCSRDTRVLLHEKWPRVAQRARALEVGEAAHLKLQRPSGGVLHMHVTPLDACHCLGAVMYLFEGDFGRVLHTGDFRWELASQPDLLAQPALAGPPIDRLYLDNTYCAPCYAFPPRLDACKEVIAAVLAHPEHYVVLGVDSLGKEELLAAVAAAVGQPICIPAVRFIAVRLLGLPLHLFTTDPTATRLSALPRHRVTVRAVAELNQRRPTLVILPSAFATANARASPDAPASSPAVEPCKPSSTGQGGCLAAADLDGARLLLVQVPYSLHSSFAELQAVVTALAPRAILPVVASSAAGKRGCADLNGHFGHLLTSSPAAAVPAQAPRAAPQKLAAAATMLQRLLGKRVATDTGSNLAQTSSWQALYAAAALVKRQRCLAAQQPP